MTRQRLRPLVLGAFCATLMHALAIGAVWWMFHPSGSKEPLFVVSVLGAGLTMLLLATGLGSAVFAIGGRHRVLAIRVLLVVVAWAGTAIVLSPPADAIVANIKVSALEKVALRGLPLITAIEEVSRNQGSPPMALDQVAGGVPSTALGLRDDLRFAYIRGERDSMLYGDDWGLRLDVPNGAMEFDLFLYLPQRKYDAVAQRLGRQARRVGDWALLPAE